jgi:phospholipase/carboxylesterase
MASAADTESDSFTNWNFRFLPARGDPSRLLVLIHGWGGDEDSMWVFARKVPPGTAVISPRGPYKIAETGYSWRAITPGLEGLPNFDDFRPSTKALIDFIDDWSSGNGMNFPQVDLIGFSQGAAISYSMALLYPARVRSVAALSGFIPAGGEKLIAAQLLVGKSVYIAHGRQDKMVPIEHAYNAVKLLERGGAKVTFCETDEGHKVSIACFSGLKKFLQGDM